MEILSIRKAVAVPSAQDTSALVRLTADGTGVMTGGTGVMAGHAAYAPVVVDVVPNDPTARTRAFAQLPHPRGAPV